MDAAEQLSGFRREQGRYERGIHSEQNLLDQFFHWWDPDRVQDYVAVSPSCQAILEDIARAAPRTDDEWGRIAADWQREDKPRRESATYWWKPDLDGRWVWEKSPLRRELRRVDVQALLGHFSLDASEEPWEAWTKRHERVLRVCQLDPWITRSRLHWYWFLQEHGLPFYPSFPDNKFSSNPGRRDRHYEDVAGLPTKTTEQLRVLLDFIATDSPRYWFNIRRTLTEVIKSRELQSDPSQAEQE